MQQLINPLPGPVDDPWSLESLAEVYAYPEQVRRGRAWLRANMVSGLDGAARLDGLSEGLSGAADKRIFGVLRALSDVVLVGAQTVRAEGYRPARARAEFAAAREAAGQRPAPVIAIVSRGLDLDLSTPLFTAPLVRTVVVTCEDSPPRPVGRWRRRPTWWWPARIRWTCPRRWRSWPPAAGPGS